MSRSQTNKSGDQNSFQRPVVVRDWPVGFRRQRQKRSRPGEASQNADFDESELVDVKQGTKTVSEYHEEFLQKTRTLERECDEEELAWLFQEGLRQELKEGVRAANCGSLFCYVSDVADEAEKVEAKLRSTKGKLPLVFEESTNVDCGHSEWGQPSSEDEVESKPSKPYDSDQDVVRQSGSG